MALAFVRAIRLFVYGRDDRIKLASINVFALCVYVLLVMSPVDYDLCCRLCQCSISDIVSNNTFDLIGHIPILYGYNMV